MRQFKISCSANSGNRFAHRAEWKGLPVGLRARHRKPCVSGDGVEPGPRRGAAVISRQRLPEFQEDILRHILRPSRVSQVHEGKTEDFALVAIQQTLNRLGVAAVLEQLSDVFIHSKP